MNPEPHDLRPAAGGEPGDHPHQWLSSLADGEEQALGRGCALWRDDPQARARWHAYHLIGDVLRSEELASDPGRDAAFLAGLRVRLAREPVPLAPPPSTSPARRLGWRAPTAVAAGFVVVAGVLALTWSTPGPGPAGSPSTLAVEPSTRVPVATAPAPGVPVAATPRGSVTTAPVPRLVLSGGQLRDPELDAYLRAHQAARGGLPTALPGGGLRSVEVILTPTPDASSSPPARGARQ
jgi:sigma-E factor negative regulatory protein RseA